MPSSGCIAHVRIRRKWLGFPLAEQAAPKKPHRKNGCGVSLSGNVLGEVMNPRIEGLILTHNLQTEVKSKVNALKKRLQREPAFPDGSPARRTIMGACQIATQVCHFRPKRTHRHGSRRVTRTLGQHRQHQRINDLRSRTLWVFTSASTHLQQAHGKRGQQTQQTDQALNRLQLPFFNATAAFETLVIVFNGLIINDKFCMSRTAQLQLSWWRLPRNARQTSSAGVESPVTGNTEE